MIVLTLMASSAFAADTLDLARRLVRYSGGVNLILRNFESGMVASVAAPAIFRQSFDQAITDNQAALAAADDQMAHAYAKAYTAEQMAPEVSFYESPEGQDIMKQSQDKFGTVVWPDPGSVGLSAAQSAALIKFHDAVKVRAAIAVKNPDATDAIMASETDALVKIRAAAFANYCKIRDCKAEHVTPPPQ